MLRKKIGGIALVAALGGCVNEVRREKGGAVLQQEALVADERFVGAIVAAPSRPCEPLAADPKPEAPGPAERKAAAPSAKMPAPAAETAAPPPEENPFKTARGDDATSTFAVDVDTASYSIVRRFLRHHQLPPPDMVRIEEMINYFDVDDPAPPADGRPFTARVEVAECPWQKGHRLARVTLKGREIDPAKRPSANLVFLIDVSGSMSPPERLPLLKQGLRLLVERLGERDRVAIVVYAGAAGLVLPPTCGREREKILAAIDGLESGGSTNGGAGIQLAYRTAIEGFVQGGMNRVLLCTDGDFNVGCSTIPELERVIEEKRKTGVFLSALGFGVGRGGDRVMETLADKGNGHYVAIDDLREARRVLVDEMSGTLVTIAKDAKVQIAWSPERVKSWRLIGYENRRMASSDFRDDKKDGGEIGAGHRVTALYEIEPAGAPDPSAALGALRLRWKEPDGEKSSEIEVPARDDGRTFDDASTDLKHAASVAAAGMLLRRSPHAGEATWAKAIRWASEGQGVDRRGDRAEWIDLLHRAARIAGAAEVEPESAGVAAGQVERGRG